MELGSFLKFQYAVKRLQPRDFDTREPWGPQDDFLYNIGHKKFDFLTIRPLGYS